jgi:predicted ATPase
MLNKLTIRGFKSIKELNSFELKDLNVLIGANGAGKSNFISFFKMLNSLMTGNLTKYIMDNGGMSDVLFNGSKATSKIEVESFFGIRGYRFNLELNAKNTAVVTNEALYEDSNWRELGSSYDDESKYNQPVYDEICSWIVYHFHDTCSVPPKTAPMRSYEIVEDNKFLRPDASNIAPFLLALRKNNNNSYNRIRDACRLIMPYFDDFLLTPQEFGEKVKVCLSWTAKGSDYPMQPYHLSDGSIRFICLATALLQPNPPKILIIDEPELGLHPAAIASLAELIQNTIQKTQIIIATQSSALVDYFYVEDIIVANRREGASTFERLKKGNYEAWLENYSVGELWSKNVIPGGITNG